MSEKRLFRKRDWLNPVASDDTGIIQSSVTLCNEDWGRSLDSEVSLSDCYKKITFNFGCSNEKKAEERIKKLDLMIYHLMSVRDHIEANKEKL